MRNIPYQGIIRNRMARKLGSLLPQVIGIAMLLWALNPENPYGYYVLLRIVICAIFAFLAFKAFEKDNNAWVWMCGVTAVIYNPIVRIHLTREIWTAVNVVTIVLLGMTIVVLRKGRSPEGKGKNADEH